MRPYALSFFSAAVAVFLVTAPLSLAAGPAKFQIGEITVWSIADAVGERDMGVFLTNRETVERYVPSGKSVSGVIALVVRTGEEVALIDTGYGRDSSLLLPGLSAIGIEPGDVTKVLITHMHGDHIGGLALHGARAFPKAKVLIGQKEYDFWLDAGNLAAFPGREANFDRSREIAVMYAGSIELFEFGDSVAPGITALNAVGHTPGHAAFMIESQGGRLLCVADLLHDSALQFARPDINSTYDMLPEWSKITRARILKRAADENLPIAGMHLPFPAVGRVKKTVEGYVYQPGLE